MSVADLSMKSRVPVQVLVALLNNERYRYAWTVGQTDFEAFLSESEWTHAVANEFAAYGNTRMLQKRLGPFVKDTSGPFKLLRNEAQGQWILQWDRNILESGTALEKAVVSACNNAMENGYEEILNSPDIQAMADDLMTNDADVENLVSKEPAEYTKDDVAKSLTDWRKAHTWEDYSKTPD